MFKHNFLVLAIMNLANQKMKLSCEHSNSTNTKPKTALWTLAILGLMFCWNLSYSQIIVESGTISAGFGVDADVQTDGTWRIYDSNGVLQDPNSGSSDDWFQNSPLFPGG